jgi:hypothetical protein
VKDPELVRRFVDAARRAVATGEGAA